jgi:hypothetical protein
MSKYAGTPHRNEKKEMIGAEQNLTPVLEKS